MPGATFECNRLAYDGPRYARFDSSVLAVLESSIAFIFRWSLNDERWL